MPVASSGNYTARDAIIKAINVGLLETALVKCYDEQELKNMSDIKPRTTCRISGEPLVPLFGLGDLYMSDFLPLDSEPRLGTVPLELMLAPTSGLVQLAHTPSFDDMYREYWYRSGTNETMTRELEDIAQKAQKLMPLKDGDVFIDIGCNDGTLLSFVTPDAVRIGFDPAKNGYKQLSQKHADLIVEDYFSADAFLATEFGQKGAKIVTSIAMFYDLEDPNAFVQDIDRVLDPEGLWILQMSYTPLMLKQLAFDNICHEHLEYYTLESLTYLLERNGMQVVDCELNDINGGSFRVYIRKASATKSFFGNAPYRDVAEYRVDSILAQEKKLDLRSPEVYMDFFQKAQSLKKETIDFIKAEKALGKKIWAYGASTKGNTLLQWFGLDHTLIEGIAERQPRKFGLKTVGTNIPIFSEEDMRAAKPDYLLVLPWHFIAEFVQREQGFLAGGGKFIVPCPRFEIIGK